MYDLYPDEWRGVEPDVEWPQKPKVAPDEPTYDAEPSDVRADLARAAAQLGAAFDRIALRRVVRTHGDTLHAIDRDPDTSPLTRYRVRRILEMNARQEPVYYEDGDPRFAEANDGKGDAIMTKPNGQCDCPESGECPCSCHVRTEDLRGL